MSFQTLLCAHAKRTVELGRVGRDLEQALEPADIVEGLRDRKEARSRGCEVCNGRLVEGRAHGQARRAADASEPLDAFNVARVVLDGRLEVVGEQWAAGRVELEEARRA